MPPVEEGALAVLCKNFLLQTLVYYSVRNELRYVLNRQRIGTGGSPANRKRRLCAADLLSLAALTAVVLNKQRDHKS